MDFDNVYSDGDRALAYSKLEFPGTYYLAFRDIPELLRTHVNGHCALDFGCGAGRSSRFLEDLGFDVTGVDISEAMLEHARARRPDSRYLLVPDGDLSSLASEEFDLVLSAFTFDNVPGREERAHLFSELRRVLRPRGRMLNLVSSPELYVHEWASFSTREFAENRRAGSGDRVRIVMLDVPDRRPVEDLLWLDGDYRELYAGAGLQVLTVHRPLGREGESFEWVSETTTPPWTIYVLSKAE